MARAYHLRPNKHIDRSLFISLLQHLQLDALEDYVYIGFGGPFLDDFRVLHKAFDFSCMISLEIDSDTYERQKMNMPCSSVDIRHCTLEDFVAGYDFDRPTIIWIDYENDAFAEQLSEAQRVLTGLAEGDVFRITMKADGVVLPGFVRGKPRDEQMRDRCTAFLGKLGPYRPSYKIDHRIFSEAVDLAPYLRDAFFRAAREARKGRDILFPLLTTVYGDTTKVITITGIITPKPKQYEAAMARWRYTESGDAIVMISSPALSAAERLAVERHLPCSVDELKARVPFTCSLPEWELRGLVRFHQHLPHFHRTSVIT